MQDDNENWNDDEKSKSPMELSEISKKKIRDGRNSLIETTL